MTLTEAEAAYRAAEKAHAEAYEVQCRLLLAVYRAELALLRLGGTCLYMPTTERIADLTVSVDQWSRVMELGEDPRSVWPQTAGAGP